MYAARNYFFSLTSCSLQLARVVTHVFLFHGFPSPKQHVDAVLSHGKVLTRDCVDIRGQLGLHYVEKELVVLSSLRTQIVVLSIGASSRAVVVCGAVSRAVMDGL